MHISFLVEDFHQGCYFYWLQTLESFWVFLPLLPSVGVSSFSVFSAVVSRLGQFLLVHHQSFAFLLALLKILQMIYALSQQSQGLSASICNCMPSVILHECHPIMLPGIQAYKISWLEILSFLLA